MQKIKNSGSIPVIGTYRGKEFGRNNLTERKKERKMFYPAIWVHEKTKTIPTCPG